MPHSRIAADPAVMMGKPVIKGTRITVELIPRKLGAGRSIPGIFEAYSHIREDDIRAALAFAAAGKAPMTRTVFTDPEALKSLCRRDGIRRLSVFGSVLKGTGSPESDVDLLVEFEPNAKVGLLDIAAIEEDLSTLVGGRKVDLRTAGDISRYFRDDVLRTAEVQYAA